MFLSSYANIYMFHKEVVYLFSAPCNFLSLVHCCNLWHYFQAAVRTTIASSERTGQTSCEVPSKDNVQALYLPKCLLKSTGDTYLADVLKVDRANIAALRSVAKKLNKSREDSIKCIEKYKCKIDEAKKSIAKYCL